jgi:hypothetical protein
MPKFMGYSKFIKYMVILSIALFSLGSSCKPENTCPGGRFYASIIPVSITPAKSIYKVGDTLHLNIDFSDRLYDTVSKKEYWFNNFNFDFTPFYVSRLDTLPATACLYECSVKPIIGKIYPSGGLYDISYESKYVYQNNRYKLSADIILKRKGLLSFNTLSVPLNLGGRYKVDFDLDCPDERYGILFRVNNGAINEQFIPEVIQEGWYKNPPIELLKNAGIYLFKVE